MSYAPNIVNLGILTGAQMAQEQYDKNNPTPRHPKKTSTTRRLQTLNRKGGAGKSTTTGSVAEELGRMGYRVLVADLDANASLTKAVGLRLGELNHSVYDVLMSPRKLLETRDAIVQLSHLNFDILPGSENLGYAEPALLMARRQHALQERLAEVEDDYDFVIIDTAGHESFMHTLGHVYADEVILPTEADIANWETIETTLASVRKVVEDGLNPKMRVRAIIVTKYQQGTKFGEAMLKKLNAEYGDLLLPVVVMQTVRVREAQAFHQPITAYAPESQPAMAYRKLAEYLERG
ncbi:ParA family protein [Streptomyces sp. NBC_00620]|uniref:ParA family protein n=1 Tax=Streptomyces sp. NBC_00620 TaxID=2903666 RepID=UPI00224EFFC5|nr:ParA family protein [Streptomyces sp. NBC_00620]MCX4976250.1 ParA family protein [Streptomyces sp. NBC_00620]